MSNLSFHRTDFILSSQKVAGLIWKAFALIWIVLTMISKALNLIEEVSDLK